MVYATLSPSNTTLILVEAKTCVFLTFGQLILVLWTNMDHLYHFITELHLGHDIMAILIHLISYIAGKRQKRNNEKDDENIDISFVTHY